MDLHSQYKKYKQKYHELKGQNGGTSFNILNIVNVLRDCFNSVKNSYKSYRFKLTPLNDKAREHVLNLMSGPFISKQIVDEIKTYNFYESFVNPSSTRFIFISKTPDIDYYKQEIVNRTVTLNKILNKTASTVIYADTPFKKVLPDPNSVIDVENVNSGFSTNSYSVIYRKEEALKVLVHELFHQYETDCGYNCYVKHTDHSINYINPNRTPRDLLINESLVESLATVVNCMFNANSFDDMLKSVDDEKQFIIKQVAKILQFYDIPDFFQTKNSIVTGASIIEYYYFKAAILHRLEDFINFLVKDGDHLLIFNRSKVDDMYKLIIQLAKDESFLKKIRNCKLELDPTMRMTVTGD